MSPKCLSALWICVVSVAASLAVTAESNRYGNFHLPYEVIPADLPQLTAAPRPSSSSSTVAHDHYSCRRHPHFKCLSVNFCVAPALVLDGVADCADGSDEDVSLVNECELGPDAQPPGFRCAAAQDSSICIDTQLGYQCLCAPGYTGNGFVCTAIPPPFIQHVSFSFNHGLSDPNNTTITVDENTPVPFVIRIQLKPDNNSTAKDINFNGFIRLTSVPAGTALDKGFADPNDNTTWIIPRELWTLENNNVDENNDDENISFQLETVFTPPHNWASNISCNIEAVISRGEFTRHAPSVRPLRIQIRPVASVPLLSVRPSCYADPNQPDLRLNIRASTGSDIGGSERLAIIVDGLPAVVGIEPVIEKLDRDSVRLDSNALHMARLIRPKTSPFAPFNLTVIAMTVEEANFDRKTVNATLVVEQCSSELGTMLNVQVGDGFALPLRQVEPFSLTLSLTVSRPDDRVQQAEVEISRLPLGTRIEMPENHTAAVPLSETSWVIPLIDDEQHDSRTFGKQPNRLIRNVTIILPPMFYGTLTLDVKGDVRYENSYFSDAKKVRLEIAAKDGNDDAAREEAPASLVVSSRPPCFLPETTDEKLVRLFVSIWPHLLDKRQNVVSLRETYSVYVRMPSNFRMADGRSPLTTSNNDDGFVQYVISYDELERANNLLELPIEFSSSTSSGHYDNITFHFTLLTTDTNTFAQTYSFFNYNFTACERVSWQEQPREKVYHRHRENQFASWPTMPRPPVLRPPYKHALNTASFGSEVSQQPAALSAFEQSAYFSPPTNVHQHEANMHGEQHRHSEPVSSSLLHSSNPSTSFFVERQPDGYTVVHSNPSAQLTGRRAEVVSPSTFGNLMMMSPSDDLSAREVDRHKTGFAVQQDVMKRDAPSSSNVPVLPSSISSHLVPDTSNEVSATGQWPSELIPYQFASKIGSKFVDKHAVEQQQPLSSSTISAADTHLQQPSSPLQQETNDSRQFDSPFFASFNPVALELLRQSNDHHNIFHRPPPEQQHVVGARSNNNYDENAVQIQPVFKQKSSANLLMKTPPYGRPSINPSRPESSHREQQQQLNNDQPDSLQHRHDDDAAHDRAIQQRASQPPVEFRPRLRPRTLHEGESVFFKFDFIRRNTIDTDNGHQLLNVIGELHLPDGYQVVSSQRAVSDGHWSVAPGVDYEISIPSSGSVGKRTVRFVGKAFTPGTSSTSSEPFYTEEKRFEIEVKKDVVDSEGQYGSNPSAAELKIDRWPVCLQRFPLRLAWHVTMHDPQSERLDKLEISLQKRDISVAPSNYSSDLTHIYLPPPGVTSGTLEIRSLWNNSIVATREPFNIEIKAYTYNVHAPDRMNVDVFRPQPLPTCMDSALPQASAKRPPPVIDYNEDDVAQLPRSSLSPASANSAVSRNGAKNAAAASQPNSAIVSKSMLSVASLVWFAISVLLRTLLDDDTL